MLSEAYLIHRSPGRFRIKIPARKGDTHYFASITEKLSRLKEIEKIAANPATASLLVLHKTETKTIAGYAESNSLFKIESYRYSPEITSQGIVDIFKEFNTLMKGITGNTLDIPGMAFLGLLGTGIYQISRGNLAAPAWYTAFWYSMNIFLKGMPAKKQVLS
ncbi:hypothetical protein MNBD_NITROSPIRAE03-50 [hydrothermal vent metagenome]|uniref:Uncharacterized protein n=1 Tax=hydrothermal vent metagenome TaxID=652676 RepID=A0A3B1DYD9_9ZZZZ